MQKYLRNSLWLVSAQLPENEELALARMFDLIERYQCGGDLWEAEDVGLIQLMREIAAVYPPEVFDLAFANDVNELEKSVGKFVVELESQQLTEADWDKITALAIQSKFTVFDERNRRFYRPQASMG